MDHVSSWLQAAVLPDWWDVANVRCKTLSVWHIFALSQLGNAYFTGQAPDKDAALSLLLFCSRDWREGRKLILSDKALVRAIRSVGRKVRRVAWDKLDGCIREYLDGCTRAPGHKQTSGKSEGRMAAAPIEWALVAWMTEGDPTRVEAAWNAPYVVARCMFDAARDIRGEDSTLETMDEERRYDAYAARKAKP